MSYAKSNLFWSLLLNLLFGCLLILAFALIVEERSKDVVRITLTSGDVYGYDIGPSVSWLQRVTGKEAVAIPLNGNSVTATKWRLQLEDRK